MAAKEKENAAAESAIRCGFHGVQSTVARAPATVLEVLLDARRRDPRIKGLLKTLRDAKVNFRAVSREELDRVSQGVKHQGVIARVAESVTGTSLDDILNALTRPALILILDQVQDPHNLGACLRTAAAAGVDAVILPKDGACPVNATVARVAAGATANLAIFYVANLARTLSELKARGIWLTGAAADAKRDLYEMDLAVDSAIILGAEGSGLRRLTREKCDQLARVPMHDSVASINVSVAAGVFLFEAVRQRLVT